MKINLIPEVKQEQIKIQKYNLLSTSVATGTGIVIAVIAAILITYNLGMKVKINSTEKNISKVTDELVAYKDLEKTVISLEEGLKSIDSIMNGGKDWNLLLAELEKVTPSDIQITDFSIKDGSISMSLVGKDLKSMDRFIKSYKTFKYSKQDSLETPNLFEDVQVSSIGMAKSGEVSFKAGMKLKGGLLW